ncbi:MAG: hypothetical protein IJK18_00160 [Clostridia bacterium]|nr:hypothetical protein [Clostridia bacterium]
MHERSIRYVIDEFRGLTEDVKKGEELEERLKKAIDGVDIRMRNDIGNLFAFNAEEILRKLKLLCIYKYPAKKDIITSMIDKELEKLDNMHKMEMKKFPEFGYGHEHEHKHKHKHKEGQER